jgi:hypothetical protein
MARRQRCLPRCLGAAALVTMLCPSLVSPPVAAQETNDDARPAPARYTMLREGELVHAGRIDGKRLRIDRFDVELREGELYLGPDIDGVRPIAVFLGDGVLRAFPPDAIEHHQLKKLSDEHQVEERFGRIVLWSAGDTIAALRDLAVEGGDPDPERALRYLDDRREDRLEERLDNPDSRVLEDLWRREAGTLAPGRAFLVADFDTRDNGWLTVEHEPSERQEVALYRHDGRRRVYDYWMRFDSLGDFDQGYLATLPDSFAVDPETLDDDEATGAALGLPSRAPLPDREGWSPRVSVPAAQVDLALEGDDDATGSAALLVEPLEPTRGLRLRISQLLEVTDVRWRVPTGGPEAPLLPAPTRGGDEIPPPDEPTALTGEPLPFVQERDDRMLDDDVFEPWVTLELPRTIAAGERIIVELAYAGKLTERLRPRNDVLLKDTIYWQPRHPDNRTSTLDLTFRMPERYRVASGGTLTEERVEADTRIMRWVTEGPVRNMSFHLGQFDVSRVERDRPPAVALFANEGHPGFAPGNRQKTIDDLTDSIALFSDYFGPFPFPSLLTTETPTENGQAFPGLLLLSYQAFGELHTGEAELFRAHEVAHQWWGAAIDWQDYRDQWMTEGFAQYAAALYALQTLDDEKQFLEMVDAWRHDVLGEGQVGQGLGLRHYGFSPGALQRSDGHDSGALVLGPRLNSTETPFDYRIIVYEKGAYILHMLRSMLLDPETGDDGRFRELMRGYATDHIGGIMSTRSFEAAVESAFGEPMAWFFDQWVYGVEVPTYRVDLEVSPLVDGRSAFALHGRIRQEEVAEGFRMPVPIRLTFDDRPPIVHRVWVDAEEVEVELGLPARPTGIEFNHQHAVLAKIR